MNDEERITPKTLHKEFPLLSQMGEAFKTTVSPSKKK